MHVGFQNRLLLGAILRRLLAKPDYGPQRLDIDAARFGLGKNILLVGSKAADLLLEVLDTLNNGLQLPVGVMPRLCHALSLLVIFRERGDALHAKPMTRRL